MAQLEPEYWQKKSLDEMSEREWEALCDGCAKCCMQKVIDEDTDELLYTNIVCDLLDTKKCSCGDYPNRLVRVPDCIKVSPKNRDEYHWFPATCAYRLLHEGKDLPDWHPLRTGSKAAMHKANMSVRGKVVHESFAGEIEDHIVTWPLELE